ncbi:hypothetical protein K1T71_007916 [Dendrolimus kikuchii]|uniref:Uncharacterized protein n=1 Tax=Dendrolimus kikuchii TaxID=765133 RepID=A0ACC1D024_9NEOP|nr:hypothetical protein K1T71_007916 [Dendrolimus kikuchii]
MENKQSLSKNKLKSIHDEKLIREVDYDTPTGSSPHLPKTQLHLDLEILQKSPVHRQALQKVLVSIKPRVPAIKTLYIAEKSRFNSKKGSEKSGSRLAIGDHSSFTTHYSENDDSTAVTSIACGTEECAQSEADSENVSSVTIQVENSAYVSQCSHLNQSSSKINLYNDKQRSAEKCYVYTQPQFNMNLSKIDTIVDKSRTNPERVDISTLIITNSNPEDSSPSTVSTISRLNKRIDHLEHKILRQEMVFRSIDPNIPLSSSDEESHEHKMRSTSGTGRPGCSYIEQYSHVPDTSAFQRYVQQAPPLSPSKATTLEKEHNSEQYGRDFTAYDGITARGKRQCASVPCKRDDIPKMAAERVHKIRHKLNPVRDYRLMDTVHYLAQGEFAPRDDGIKLTPSREAVLSDIIWEDVCRTHWPNTRLGRRGHSERCNDRGSTRYELQRLIDGLLRERVAHVERRRRRHYRIVKLNHRHESCRPMGKTGDIIVASHKNRQNSEDMVASDHNIASAMVPDSHWEDRSLRTNNKSHDRIVSSNMHHKRRSRPEDCCPGPSYASKSIAKREPTCCYHTSNSTKSENTTETTPRKTQFDRSHDLTSGSSVSACKPKEKKPRLVIKKDGSRRKSLSPEEPNLEHYILLPTLVVRTPSNVKRQKKFNELYHRILNVQLNNGQFCSETMTQSAKPEPNKKDIGFNINITLSNSAYNNDT